MVETVPEEKTPAPITNAERQQPVVAPTVSSNQNDETIAALRAEIASLKASLDTLYASHNSLTDNHNSLLEYTKSIAAQKEPTTVVQQADTSAIEHRMSELERKAKLVSDELYGDDGLNLKVSRLQSSLGLGSSGSQSLEKAVLNICYWAFGDMTLGSCSFSRSIFGGSVNDRLNQLERAD